MQPQTMTFSRRENRSGAVVLELHAAATPNGRRAGHRTTGEMTVADLNDPSDTGGQLIAASKVNGTTVYNKTGEKLGSIYDVMLDKVSGQANYAVMSFGGFLGIGDRYHPLPWQALTYDPGQGGYVVVDVDCSRLVGAPSHAADESCTWDDPAYGRRVNDYYGQPTTLASRLQNP